jgi:hypothetical protein
MPAARHHGRPPGSVRGKLLCPPPGGICERHARNRSKSVNLPRANSSGKTTERAELAGEGADLRVTGQCAPGALNDGPARYVALNGSN